MVLICCTPHCVQNFASSGTSFLHRAFVHLYSVTLRTCGAFLAFSACRRRIVSLRLWSVLSIDAAIPTVSPFSRYPSTCSQYSAILNSPAVVRSLVAFLRCSLQPLKLLPAASRTAAVSSVLASSRKF